MSIVATLVAGLLLTAVPTAAVAIGDADFSLIGDAAVGSVRHHDDVDMLPCYVEEPCPELVRFHEAMAANEHLARRSLSNSTVDGQDEGGLVSIDVYLNIIAPSADDVRPTEEHILKMAGWLQDFFRPFGFLFVPRPVRTIFNRRWGKGWSKTEMISELHQGDEQALNLIFINTIGRFDPGWSRMGECSYPNLELGKPDFYKRDACLLNYFEGNFKTLVHEVGHWFGLFHPYHGSDCAGENDLVADTPASQNSTTGCPQKLDTCPHLPGLDPVGNFMDVTPVTCGMDHTPGQRQRLRDLWQMFRSRKDCQWFGTAPFCDGTCPDGWRAHHGDPSGDGDKCLTGHKTYCCPLVRSLLPLAPEHLSRPA
ncbi:hypothetical protein DCS_05556 [Drechmeria coniospora]|uniref:Peptidase M43 pregnancy-associated plasma-A domain-containing protein n=1 Tax=Drechmeria coniospora TaxID=98403 RepID=A0A151GN55_DRECN|nr:hypothetical protein DCS_05556 [Drechmeria coniospora]KYK58539.1 hypothetical protein DCS_05556 [Drechmeria coniospora]